MKLIPAEYALNKTTVIKKKLADRYLQPPTNKIGKAFAPTNIALVKYWGKRNQELNLPMTSSLSISLGNKGAETILSLNDKSQDEIMLNGNSVDLESAFAKRLFNFLNLFRTSSHTEVWDPVSSNPSLTINIKTNIPIAAGLASSACGFAALIKALDNLYNWNLSIKDLSILARLGSGSASRSLWNGFVEWHQGEREDGEDSHGERIDTTWAALRIGLLIMDVKEKNISSRLAMQRTVETSQLYSAWPKKVSTDLHVMKQAIATKDFELLGKTAESNALNMHATMLAAWPPVNFSLPETLNNMQKIWQLRAEGLPVYFTQDAGPNLKLLFLKNNQETLTKIFPSLEVVQPF